MILRGLEKLPRFIVGGCNLNSTCYTVLMTDSEKKLNELSKVVEESKKKRLTISFKNTAWLSAEEATHFELRKSNYLSSI